MTYNGNLVVDMVVHAFNFSPTNWKGDVSEQFAEGAFGRQRDIHPGEYRMERERFFKDHRASELEGVVFRESDIDYAVYQSVAITDYFEDGLITLEKGKEFVSRNPDRSTLYGCINPIPDDATETLERMAADEDIDAIKLYPAYFEDGESLSLWLDDPETGRPIVEKARDLGIDIIAVHKNLPIGRTHQKYFRPDDIESAAAQFPDMKFEVVHAGYAFQEETNSLLARFPNVYANLESTMSLMLPQPRQFAHSLGQMLLWAGPDKVMFGSGASVYHPQVLIEEFWDFQIPKDLRDEYGYPKLTQEIKSKILGLNACEFLELSPGEIPENTKQEGVSPWESISPVNHD